VTSHQDWLVADASRVSSRQFLIASMANRKLSESCFSHLINAPIESVDLGDWLLSLRSAEFQRCCPLAHIACGATTSDGGHPVSIYVELIGDSLFVQHFARDVIGPQHCRLVSTSDVFGPHGRTTADIVWDLSVAALDDSTCEYINHVTATATDQFLGTLAGSDDSFEQIAAARHTAYLAHNEQETRGFAESIERHALVLAVPPLRGRR
jgi:hypothetical protein